MFFNTAATKALFLQVLHYAQELFEGMKAYRGVDGKIRMFRPMHNMARMNLTASRACLPAFDGYQLLECIRKYGKFYDEYHVVTLTITPQVGCC